MHRVSLFLKIGLGILFVILTVYLLLVGIVWAAQEHLLFRGRTHDVNKSPQDFGWPFEEVWVQTPEGRSHGWWIPLEGARGTVLFSHGSGKNIAHYLDDAAIFRDGGYSVLLYDYGGYGRSEGVPSEERCYADALAFWEYLTKTRHIPSGQIALAGASMGSGVTTWLALQVNAGAVILENAFVSAPDVVADAYPWIPAHWIARIRFPNIDRVGKIPCPVLIIHTRDDRVVPFAHGQRLYAAQTGDKRFLEIRGSHGGGKFSSGVLYADGLHNFLEEYIR